MWCGKLVYNDPNAFHKRKSEFHDWYEKAITSGHF